MGDNEPLKESLASLLGYLGITRVICVDDDTAPAELEPLIERITPDTELPARLRDKIEGRLNNDPATRRQQLLEGWSKLRDFAKRQSVVFDLSADLKGDLPDGATPFSAELKALIDPIRVQNISPRDWETRKNDEGQYTWAQKALVLFDYDLHNAPPLSTTGGALLARNFLSAHPDAFCGIATSHAHNSEDAAELEVEIASNAGEGPGHLFVIAKDAITKAPDQFAIRLKRLILRPSADQLRNAARKALDEAHAAAMIAFAKIDVLQLADLVHSAHEDGAWEMDSLRRLYNVEFRDALRPTERKDGLPGLANNICTVRAALPEFPGIGAENLKFQARERYEPGQSINAAFLPIQLGDIFTREDGAEFLLLAQACDIVLRSKGTRTTTFGFMVPVTKTAPHANASETVFVLEWFFSDSNSVPSGSGYAIFKKAFPVPLFALDVAAYNADGNCRLTADDIVPSGLHDAARNRFDRVFKMASALTSVLSPDESIELRAFPHGCQELPGKLTNAKPWTLRFPCQRTGRVAMPYAIAVLTKYTQFLSRTAFERPFGAPVLSEQPDTE